MIQSTIVNFRTNQLKQKRLS